MRGAMDLCVCVCARARAYDELRDARPSQVEDSLQRKRLQYAILGNQRTEDGRETRQ